MPEKIFTIPINEAFDAGDGCPLCRLADDFERRTLSYTLGAAMMEPDVRITMNRSGFCSEHFRTMQSMKNRLSLALICESHLDELLSALESEPSGGKKPLFSRKAPDGTDACEAMGHIGDDCFVCRRINDSMLRCYSNVAYLWASDPDFRDKLRRQPFFCAKHFSGILSAAKSELSGEQYGSLYRAMCELERAHISSLRRSITEFCESFDHKNADKPLSDDARRSLDDFLRLL